MDQLDTAVAEKIAAYADHKTQCRMGMIGKMVNQLVQQRRDAIYSEVKDFHHLGEHIVMSKKKKRLDELCAIGDLALVKRLERFGFSNLLNAIISGNTRIVSHVLDSAVENKAVNNDGQRGDMLIKAAEHGKWDVFNVLYCHSSMEKYIPHPNVVFRVLLNMGRTHPNLEYIGYCYPKLSIGNIRAYLMAGVWWEGRIERKFFSVPQTHVERDMMFAGALASKNTGIIAEAKAIVGPNHRFENGYDVIAASNDAEVVAGFLADYPGIEVSHVGFSALGQRKKTTVETIIKLFPRMKQPLLSLAIKTYGNDEIVRLLYEPEHHADVICSRYHYIANAK